MTASCKRFAHHLSLLLAALFASANIEAAGTPANAGSLENISQYTSRNGWLIINCLTFYDRDGQSRRYSALLNHGNLGEFTILSTALIEGTYTKPCRGQYRNGVYTDMVYINSATYPYYHGAVWNIVLDQVPGSSVFRLRMDSSFSLVRRFSDNSTQLGSDLGDFTVSTVREYGAANVPASIAMKLPQCNDPEGDETRAIVMKDGVPLGAGQPGSTILWNTSGITAGEYQFQSHCSDEVGVRQLSDMGFSANAYIAPSPPAPGTLRVRIIQGQ